MFSYKHLFLKHIGQTTANPLLLEISHAKGIFLYDLEGRKYTDLISGISVSSLGHNNSDVKKAVKKQLKKHLHLMVYGEMIQSIQVKLVLELLQTLPPQLDNIYFVNSGSEATEGAMKLAKKYTNRSQCIAMKAAYHGSTHGALSLCGDEYFRNAYRPLLPAILSLNFNNFEDLKQITEETAAVFVETIQAEAGVMLPQEHYLKALRIRCTEVGALLIVDEIQTGIGRTGHFWAFQAYDFEPDIVLTGKALGGGLPLAAFIAPAKIMAVLKDNPILGHITTFGGHPLSCAAALAGLKFLNKQKLIASIKVKENLFLKYLVHKHIKAVRSAGLLIAVELENADYLQHFIAQSLEKGLIIDWFLFHESAFRLAPPLIITPQQIRKVCAKILNILETL